jgi:uncharacterized membrane protein YuzA (DUF378 family)
MSAGYRGLPGAFPFAYRSSSSWLFRSYVVLGGFAAAFVGLLFGAGVVALIGQTTGVGGGTFTLSRAFFVLVGFLAVFPMVAPVLLVARRHRHGRDEARYDAAMAATGFCYLLGLWLGAVFAAPAAPNPPAILAPAPPLAAVALMWAVHRRYANGSRG